MDERLAPFYYEGVKVERMIDREVKNDPLYLFQIQNKNGDFVLRVDKDLELCSMQFNKSSGRWMKEDLIKLKALLNSCNLL